MARNWSPFLVSFWLEKGPRKLAPFWLQKRHHGGCQGGCQGSSVRCCDAIVPFRTVERNRRQVCALLRRDCSVLCAVATRLFLFVLWNGIGTGSGPEFCALLRRDCSVSTRRKPNLLSSFLLLKHCEPILFFGFYNVFHFLYNNEAGNPTYFNRRYFSFTPTSIEPRVLICPSFLLQMFVRLPAISTKFFRFLFRLPAN